MRSTCQDSLPQDATSQRDKVPTYLSRCSTAEERLGAEYGSLDEHSVDEMAGW